MQIGELTMTDNMLLREWLAGFVFPLSVFLSILIGLYLTDMFWTYRRGWTRQPGVSLACALWWIFTAEAVRAFLIWATFRSINDGVPVPDKLAQPISIIMAASSAVLLVAMLRCTYLFTPSRWGRWVWVAAAITAVIVVTLGHVIPTA